LRSARNATGGMNDVAPWDGAFIPDQPADYRAMVKTHRLGGPPRVIWLGLGNYTTENVVRWLRARGADPQAFAEQAEATFLELG
jgi:predicted nuclease of predicted toxin-antitoxin system